MYSIGDSFSAMDPLHFESAADYISRLIDTDDWQITDEFFYFFLMAGGARMVLNVLPISIITSSPNTFLGKGTPILQGLIFLFSLFKEKIA